MKIFLTGANGFIGSAVYPAFLKKGWQVVFGLRKKKQPDVQTAYPGSCFYYDSLNEDTNFRSALEGIDVVVHLAARAHMHTRSDFDLYKGFMDINFHATRNLAQQAAQQGVKRFVFISSIGVNGKSTDGRSGYTENDREAPYNSYTHSKLSAEKSLRKIERDTGLDVVIIRPPLVYGPNVKANFLKLMQLVHRGFPLPFSGLDNQRSFIAIENLVDAIIQCVIKEKASGETFLVSDSSPLSTTQLLETIFRAFGMQPRLFPFPAVFFLMFFKMWDKKGVYDRLWGSLTVNSEKIQTYLDWTPPVTTEEGIKKTVEWYLEKRK